jgi:hypothetical protein
MFNHKSWFKKEDNRLLISKLIHQLTIYLLNNHGNHLLPFMVLNNLMYHKVYLFFDLNEYSIQSLLILFGLKILINFKVLYLDE